MSTLPKLAFASFVLVQTFTVNALTPIDPAEIPGLDDLELTIPQDPCDAGLLPEELCRPVIPKCEEGSFIYPQCIQLMDLSYMLSQTTVDDYNPSSNQFTIVNSSAYTSGDNVIVSVDGYVNTGGWSNIGLDMVMYFIQPADGIQDIVLRGTPPDGMATQALSEFHATTKFSKSNWLKGVRIHSGSMHTGSDSVVVMLDNNKLNPTIANDDYWPFPLKIATNNKTAGASYYAICSHHSHGTTGWTSPLKVKKYALAEMRHHNKANKGHAASLSN